MGGRGHATHQKHTIIIYSASQTYISIQLPFSLHILSNTHRHVHTNNIRRLAFFCSSFLHLLLLFACRFFFHKMMYNFILCLVTHFIMMTWYSYNVQNFMTQKIARFDGWYDHAFSVTHKRMFYYGNRRKENLCNYVIALNWSVEVEIFLKNSINSKDNLFSRKMYVFFLPSKKVVIPSTRVQCFETYYCQFKYKHFPIG